jgi:hypothetical protein
MRYAQLLSAQVYAEKDAVQEKTCKMVAKAVVQQLLHGGISFAVHICRA